MQNRKDCEALDATDELAVYRTKFHIPEATIYLDGNSLGPLPKGVSARIVRAIDQEWGQDLISSWNKNNWFVLALSAAAKIGTLIGAAGKDIAVGDSISVNLFKVLSAALKLRPDRKIILTDKGNFPSDIYVAERLATYLEQGHTVAIHAPEDIAAHITKDIAVVMLTEIDYRTGNRHDMAAITKAAHAAGALVIWDLAHTAGALPCNVMGINADFAVGCTYKYLNGGPGAPGFLFVHPDHAKTESALVGWWGHKHPFDFTLEFDGMNGARGMQVGTAPILSLTALDEALDVWKTVDMHKVQKKSQKLCQLFIDLAEKKCGKFGLKLSGSRDMSKRGSHVSFHVENGYAVIQSLIAHKIIGDFRAPDMIRFGMAPLYLRYVDIYDAVEKLHMVLDQRLWADPAYNQRLSVT